MKSEELWNRVKQYLDAAKKWTDEHPAAKVVAGGGLGAVVGKKVSGDKGASTGAIIGALAAIAHNNRINSKRLEGGQDYLAQGQQMAVKQRFCSNPQAAIETFRDMARSKYASAIEKIAAGYNGWAGSERISNDEALDVVDSHGQALRGQQKALQDKANKQKTIGIAGMGLGSAGGGYAAKGLVGISRTPAGIGRMRIAGKAGLTGLVGAGLLYGGKKMYDKHHATSAEAKQVGEKAKATENWVNYFNAIKGKLR